MNAPGRKTRHKPKPRRVNLGIERQGTKMQILTEQQIANVSGGVIDADEGADMILASGAMGGPATFCFALPIAAALYYLS